MSINEYTFSVDDFETPKVLKDAKAVSTLLVRLLLLEPGTIQSHPNAGVGLISRFRYSSEEEAVTLQSEFQKQIETYYPNFHGVKVSVSVKDGNFMISAEISGILYGIYYDVNASDVQTNYIKLSDL